MILSWRALALSSQPQHPDQTFCSTTQEVTCSVNLLQSLPPENVLYCNVLEAAATVACVRDRNKTENCQEESGWVKDGVSSKFVDAKHRFSAGTEKSSCTRDFWDNRELAFWVAAMEEDWVGQKAFL